MSFFANGASKFFVASGVAVFGAVFAAVVVLKTFFLAAIGLVLRTVRSPVVVAFAQNAKRSFLFSFSRAFFAGLVDHERARCWSFNCRLVFSRLLAFIVVAVLELAIFWCRISFLLFCYWVDVVAQAPNLFSTSDYFV